MRRLIVCLSLAFICACSAVSTEIKESKNPICTLTETHLRGFRERLNVSSPGSSTIVNYCGQLADPDSTLGMALVEVTIPSQNTEVEHLFFIMKFALTNDRWELLGWPEIISRFTSPRIDSTTVQPEKSIKSSI